MENINTDNRFYNYVLLDPRKPGDYNYGDLHFDFEPFYVGKGQGKRCFKHKGKDLDNNFKSKKINKILSLGLDLIVLKIYENLSEQESFDNEINLINQIGRFNLNLGPLTNLTNGGDGPSGYICSNESKQRMSESKKGNKNALGYKHSDETKQSMSESRKGNKNGLGNKSSLGLKRSDETKQRMSESQKGNKNSLGYKHSDETKQRISKSQKGKKYCLGYKHSDETKQRMSESHKGKKYSDETK